MRKTSLPDDEVRAPLGVLVEDVVDLIQHLTELGELEGALDLRQDVRLRVFLLFSA